MLPVWKSCPENVWLILPFWDSKIFGKKSLNDNTNIQDCEYANGICSFITIFNIIFHPWKCCYAPCVWTSRCLCLTRRKDFRWSWVMCQSGVWRGGEGELYIEWTPVNGRWSFTFPWGWRKGIISSQPWLMLTMTCFLSRLLLRCTMAKSWTLRKGTNSSTIVACCNTINQAYKEEVAN